MQIFIEPVSKARVPNDFLSSVTKLQCESAQFLASSPSDPELENKYPSDANSGSYSLQSDWDAEKSAFRTKSLSVPAYAAHCVRAICSIFPLDRYLAAHYENQMRAAIFALSDKDAEFLARLAISQDADASGASEEAAAFLKFQRKLYLAYARED